MSVIRRPPAALSLPWMARRNLQFPPILAPDAETTSPMVALAYPGNAEHLDGGLWNAQLGDIGVGPSTQHSFCARQIRRMSVTPLAVAAADMSGH